MINLQYLNKTFGDNKEVQQQILKLFLEQSSDFSNNMQSYSSNLDFENIEKLAHKAKNSFGIIGATEQAEVLQKIESLAEQKDPDNKLPKLILQIIKDNEQILKEVADLCK